MCGKYAGYPKLKPNQHLDKNYIIKYILNLSVTKFT